MHTDAELVQAFRDATDDYHEELARHHKTLREISGRRYGALCALVRKGRTQTEIAQLVGLSSGYVNRLVMRSRRRNGEA